MRTIPVDTAILRIPGCIETELAWAFIGAVSWLQACAFLTQCEGQVGAVASCFGALIEEQTIGAEFLFADTFFAFQIGVTLCIIGEATVRFGA